MLLVALVTTLASCHDAHRTNPVDPALTPAVTGVEAVVSDSAAAVLLAWQPYEGDMPFDRYLVLRNLAKSTEVETLAVVSTQDVTTFVDTTASPHRDYEYRVAVVNQAGFLVPSALVAVRSFGVSGVGLVNSQASARTGVVTVVWQPYRGRGFGGYQVWRRTFGEDPRLLASIESKEVSVWQDTTARPNTVYTYWVHSSLLGEEFDSTLRQVSFELPAVEITELVVSSDCACARLSWSEYQGPRFAAYEVLRRTGNQADSLVAEFSDPSATSATDSLLEGNTEYAYRVRVSTTWEGTGGAVEGAERSGLFHGLRDVRRLQAESDTEVQAIDLATEGTDQVYAAVTAISSTTARVMKRGVRLHFPTGGARTYLSQVLPDRLSAVRVAAGQGWVFVAVADTSGQLNVAGIAPDRTEAWQTTVGTGRLAGLYVDDEHVVVADDEGLLYRLRAEDGQEREVEEGLRKALAGLEGLPLQDLVFLPGRLGGGNDQWFLLAPGFIDHMVLSRIRTSPAIIGGGAGQTFDDGIGPGLGQSLNPLALDLDPARARLVVMESRGLLQVLDAREGGLPRHYITRWGSFGQGAGEFQVTPPTAVAVAVDAQGSIHVADAGTPGGRIQTFAP